MVKILFLNSFLSNIILLWKFLKTFYFNNIFKSLNYFNLWGLQHLQCYVTIVILVNLIHMLNLFITLFQFIKNNYCWFWLDYISIWKILFIILFFERSSLTLNSSYRCSLYFNVALFINKLLYINQYLMNIDLLFS